MMSNDITKSVVVPLDGSPIALKALNYLLLVFGAQHNLIVNLFHVVPVPPPILVEESKKDPDTARQVRELESRSKKMAAKTLSDGKNVLLDKGFKEEQIKTLEFHKQVGIARDICGWSEKKSMDAIVLNTHGRSRIEAFFMGETANKVLELSRICPVWMIKGNVRSKPVIIAMDNSENALRAVDHAAFMLSGTDCQVTLFYSKRNLLRFFSKEAVEPIEYGWCMLKNCCMKTLKTSSIKLTNRTDAKNQKKTGWMIYSPVFDDVLKMICQPLTELQEPSVERSWE